MVRRAANSNPGVVQSLGCPRARHPIPIAPHSAAHCPPGLCVCSLLVCVKDGLNAEVKNTILCVVINILNLIFELNPVCDQLFTII